MGNKFAFAILRKFYNFSNGFFMQKIGKKRLTYDQHRKPILETPIG